MWGLLKSKVSEFITKLTGEAKKDEEGQKPAGAPVEEILPKAGVEGARGQNEAVVPPEQREEQPKKGSAPAHGEEKPLPNESEIAPTIESKSQEGIAAAPKVGGATLKERHLQREAVAPQPQGGNAPQQKEIAPHAHEGERTLPKGMPKIKGQEAPVAGFQNVPHEKELREVRMGQEQQGFKIPFLPQQKKPAQEEAVKVRVGITDHLKKMVLRKVRLGREKVEAMALDLEFALIQSDVHPDVAKEVCEKVVERISDREFISAELEDEIRSVLREVFREEAFGTNKPFDIVELAKSHKKPFKILFVGPNGAGKTTTIAKVAHKLMENGMTVVISASDTFRAAAIEQSEEHGRRLGVRVIRHNYGADSAAVAFDAIRHAEANKVDVVLIDSAGRQDTNFNLIRELEKLNRVAAPDLRIFVGESLAGNSLYQQVKTFNDAIKLDGIILTKADCDAKGGTAISILRETGVPIIYLGMGQKYGDLVKFDPEIIISNIL
ncbi:MAG: signal recognition particle-docking protein FtsY [Candidatus Micrarchaeota archaeon]|nr:signal recognition particle-docking protein FtsY [Candidatus Micrarchaeota archaeon]